ncbi:hypothetical protein C8J57DRAFT_1215905 [Mycena rebaudengoi]|nr:hypothetical protein C8J57DRAFT_1215905 [Mycena rebaudengoi]
MGFVKTWTQLLACRLLLGLFEGCCGNTLPVASAALWHPELPDILQKNKFLTEKQTNLVLNRVEEDRGDSLTDEISISKVLHHLCFFAQGRLDDLGSAGMFLSAMMPSYAIGCFLTLHPEMETEASQRTSLQ